MPADLPDLLNIPYSGGLDPAEYVGPAGWGGIYRSTRHPAYYRVLRQSEAPIESMQSAREWAQGPSRPAIAPITDVRTWFADDISCVYIRYAPAYGRTLLDVLQSLTSPIERIQHVGKAVGCLHRWRIHGGSDVSPMPAEILFDGEGKPILLAAPFRPALSVEDLLDCPVRALFISPERLRGVGAASDDAESLYGFIVMAALALGRIPEFPEADTILHGAARGLVTAEALQGTLPRWMDQLDAIKEMRNEIFRLLAAPAAERRSADPDDMAARLKDWSERSTPLVAVSLLQQSGRLQEAIGLVRGVLGYEASYDLLILGAVLSEIGRSPLEGVEYLERAITMKPDGMDAVEMQLQLITRNPVVPPATQGQDPSDWSSRWKSMLWRNFDRLPADIQKKQEHGVAGFLIARSDFAEALGFIYPRMFDAENVHLWWKFDISLDYAEALMGSGAVQDAQQQLHGIRLAIDRSAFQHSVEEEILVSARKRHQLLERRLHAKLLQARAGGVS